MKLQSFQLAAAVVVTIASCKSKEPDPAKQPVKDPAVGSGSGSAAGEGSGSGTKPNAELTAPHGIPLTGEALAKHFSECLGNLNAGKLDDVKQHCFDPAVAIHEVDFDDFQGADVTLDYYQTMRTAMPDWKIEPQLVLVSGRNIHAISLVTGKHTGTLKLPDNREVKATDKKVGLLLYQHLQTSPENKTVEEWEYMDHHTLEDQLGFGEKTSGPTRPVLDKGWAGAPIVLVTKDDSAEEANIVFATKATEALNGHKAADVAALFADDATLSDQGDHEDYRGKVAIMAGVQTWLTAFPDAKVNVSHSVAAGDYVFVEGTLTGTHKGTFGGVAPTNKAIITSYADVFRIKDGKIAEAWRFRDQMALTAQLTAPAKPAPEPKKKGN